jgi:Family of unknown function (DUF6178)
MSRQQEGGNLSLFLNGSLRITSKQQLEEFLLQPKARQLVRSIPYQDLFLVIKTIGLADSLELLPLTSKEQKSGFFDLDCWRKDAFHVRSFMQWLAAFIQFGPEETVRMARAMDPELLSLFLKDNIQVYALELDEPPPDLALIFTPDNRFGIEITGETEGATMSRLILDALFRFDPSLGYDLIDRVRWENRVCLEEEAYQNKRRRLEEIGFVDYYEALDIYGQGDTPLPPKSAKLGQGEESAVPLSTTLPALFVASLAPSDYLREALQGISEPREAERISQSLAALANRILSVHSVTPGDLEKVKPALQEMHDTLSLGLEHLTQGRKKLATEVLKRNEIQGLFKIGFSVLTDLRRQADLILNHRGVKIEGQAELLLEFPEAEFFSGLRRQRPLFFEGLEDPRKVTYRNFESMADIESSKRVLKKIEILARSFWKLFTKSDHKFPAKALKDTNLSLDEIHFSQIFNTALVNKLVKDHFIAQILTVPELKEFLKQASNKGEGQLADWMFHSGQTYAEEIMGNSDDKAVLFSYIERWTKVCADELVLLLGKGKIEPRYLKTLLLEV